MIYNFNIKAHYGQWKYCHMWRHASIYDIVFGFNYSYKDISTLYYYSTYDNIHYDSTEERFRKEDFMELYNKILKMYKILVFWPKLYGWQAGWQFDKIFYGLDLGNLVRLGYASKTGGWLYHPTNDAFKLEEFREIWQNQLL